MNSQAARTMRRHGVITTLDTQAEALGALRAQIVVLSQRQDQMEGIQHACLQTLARHATELGGFSFSVPHHGAQLEAFEKATGTFWGRLRWLLRG